MLSDTGEHVQEESEASLLDLLVIVIARRRLILLCTVAVAAVALLLGLVLPKMYTAVTTILPPQGASSSGAAMLAQVSGLASLAGSGGGGAASALGLKNPNDLQVALLKSATVENAMIDRFHLMQEYHAKRRSAARHALEKAVKIADGKDGLITVSVTDRSPERAAELANGYIEEFRRATAGLAETEASQRRLFFEQQLKGAKDDLAHAEESLKATEQATGLIQVESQARAVIQSAAQLRGEIAAKEVEIRGLESFAAPDNPQLKTAEDELAGLRAEQAKLGVSDSDSDNALPIPKGNMQQSSLEYVRKLRDVKYYETIFDALARQYEAAKVDEARQGALIQVVDRATVPDSKSSPKLALMLIGGVALGLVLGIVWAFAGEGLRRLQADPEGSRRLQALREAASGR